MKNVADIFDRVYKYGMDRANLEASVNSIQTKVRLLGIDNKNLQQENETLLDRTGTLEIRVLKEVSKREEKERGEQVALRQVRLLMVENEEWKAEAACITKEKTQAVTALKTIASGGASKIGMKRYASETLQKIRKGE